MRRIALLIGAQTYGLTGVENDVGVSIEWGRVAGGQVNSPPPQRKRRRPLGIPLAWPPGLGTVRETAAFRDMDVIADRARRWGRLCDYFPARPRMRYRWATLSMATSTGAITSSATR